MKNKLSYYIWVEQFRPETIADTILPQSLKRCFNKYVLKDKEIPNLLFHSSSPGVGKTTVAKALCKELEIDYLYINTSSDRGIDILRSNVQKYASVKTLEGKTKIVIMDEFDGATIELQNAMRAAIEEFHKSCRFIFTANFITKIIQPLKSRCQVIDFNFTELKTREEMLPKILKRLEGILTFKKIEWNPETLKKLVETFYPDIRKMIQLLQQYYDTHGIIDNNIFQFERIDDEFYEYLIKKQLTNARKYLIERNYNSDSLFRNLFDVFVPRLPKDKQSQAILLIAEYQYRNSFVVDKEIGTTALLLELIGIMD